MEELRYKSACELSQLIRKGDLSPVELVESCLARIEEVNPLVNAFVALRAEEALTEAKTLADDIARGQDPGPLAGIPIGVKDLEDVKGMPTTYGSIPFKGNVAGRDSIQVGRLKKAGAIVLGKTNTPEFGFTGFTKNRLFGITRNPWNLERTPGGSSGGSAAAVASGMVPISTGSDAGGSIRIPACYTGCFGIKPTYGRIPLGPAPVLNTTCLWTLGPLCRTVEDAALYLDITSGYHPADPASLPTPHCSYLHSLKADLPPLRIAFSPDMGFAPVQKDVMDLAQRTAGGFEELGHHVEIWKGRFPDVSETWSDLVGKEIYAQLSEILDRYRDQIGRAIVAALDHVKTVTLDTWIQHAKTITALNNTLWQIFEEYDLLLTPTLPTEAFAAGGPPPMEIEGQSIPILWAVAFTYPFNLSAHPAATVRSGLTRTGLPAGLQIIGPHHGEDLVLRAAYAYQQLRPWNDHWPKVSHNRS